MTHLHAWHSVTQMARHTNENREDQPRGKRHDAPTRRNCRTAELGDSFFDSGDARKRIAFRAVAIKLNQLDRLRINDHIRGLAPYGAFEPHPRQRAGQAPDGYMQNETVCRKRSFASCGLLGALLLAGTRLLFAQHGPTTAELQKAVQNTIADLISVPFQNNTNFPVGQYWNPITRRITPVVYQPNITEGDGGARRPGRPEFRVSARRDLGCRSKHNFLARQPRPGEVGSRILSGVVLAQSERWTIGAFVNNIGSYADGRTREPNNQLLLHYFVTYYSHWRLTTSWALTIT